MEYWNNGYLEFCYFILLCLEKFVLVSFWSENSFTANGFDGVVLNLIIFCTLCIAHATG
jgi:hypothetical protein